MQWKWLLFIQKRFIQHKFNMKNLVYEQNVETKGYPYMFWNHPGVMLILKKIGKIYKKKKYVYIYIYIYVSELTQFTSGPWVYYNFVSYGQRSTLIRQTTLSGGKDTCLYYVKVEENERGLKTRIISSIGDKLLCLVPAGWIKLCPPIEGSTLLAKHEVVLFY